MIQLFVACSKHSMFNFVGVCCSSNELKNIISHNLGNKVRPISKMSRLSMAFGKVFFLQMKPSFVAHLKLVCHAILVVSLCVLSIGYVQYVMELLADLINALCYHKI